MHRAYAADLERRGYADAPGPARAHDAPHLVLAPPEGEWYRQPHMDGSRFEGPGMNDYFVRPSCLAWLTA